MFSKFLCVPRRRGVKILAALSASLQVIFDVNPLGVQSELYALPRSGAE